MTRLALFAAASLLVVACGGGAGGSDENGSPTPPPNGSGQGSSSGGDPSTNPPGSSSGTTTTPPSTGPNGPKINIKMKGSTAPIAFQDSWAGETPRKQIVAIKSLYLLRTTDDKNPLKVFDNGTAAVEAELIGGKTTDIASVVAKTLSAGVFTIAKAGAAYVRYEVDARMHTTLGPVDGYYANVQALSDSAVIDGVPFKKGHFRYSFISQGTTYGTLEGENAPTPAVSAQGGLYLDTTGSESFYVFPVQLAVDPNISKDLTVSLELNVHESFRWQDQALLGYSSKVFDTTPYTYEPVMAFGANAFTMKVE
jgi:hypothetical protein